MRIFDGIGRRLDQSARLMDKLDIVLPSTTVNAESQIRNVMWRCVLCRHGDECREWLDVPDAGIPAFCANAAFFRGRQQASREARSGH
ncbi:MAG: DUF6455 family protein [Rhizobiaceae bacterium]|nr:DUF6455 family protein [Rhizobiaceae bacterium]MCV0408972.1 DUF6455 family protein [Rhizobiaceae bacterium]